LTKDAILFNRNIKSAENKLTLLTTHKGPLCFKLWTANVIHYALSSHCVYDDIWSLNSSRLLPLRRFSALFMGGVRKRKLCAHSSTFAEPSKIHFVLSILFRARVSVSRSDDLDTQDFPQKSNTERRWMNIQRTPDCCSNTRNRGRWEKFKTFFSPFT